VCENCEWSQAILDLDSVLGDCKDIAESQFADDVREQSRSMRAVISEWMHVTKKQLVVIKHFRDAVDRWFDE